MNEKFPNLTMESCESLGSMHQRGRQIPPPATPNPGSTSIHVRVELVLLYEPSRLVLPLTTFGGEAAIATCVLVCHAVMGLSTYTQMATYKLVQAKSQDVGLSLLPDWLSHESRLRVQRCSNASISLAPAAVYPPSFTSRRRRALQLSMYYRFIFSSSTELSHVKRTLIASIMASSQNVSPRLYL